MATASERAAEAPWRAPPPLLDGLLAGLTPEQTQAVCHGPGVLLIVAGPGAGKTKTLIHRIAWLLAQGLAEPREILAVTFSVRAASELRLRLAELLGEQTAAQVSAATFHSICAGCSETTPSCSAAAANWTVYDQVEVRKVVDWLLSDRQRTAIQQALADFGQPASSEVLHEISLAKNRLLTPESYEQAARHPAGPLIAAVWRETEAELRRSNAMDFDDLLVCAVRLLAEHPHYLELYRRRWPWILVDEYQDTCQAQADTGLPARDRGREPGRRRRRRSGLVLVPRRRRARAGQARRTVPHPRADRARTKLPLPRRDPLRGRPVDPAQPRPGAQDADRDARARRTGRRRSRSPQSARRPPGSRRRWPRSFRRAPHRPRSFCWRGPGTRTGRYRPRSRPPASPTGCSARSASTSARRYATRSPT